MVDAQSPSNGRQGSYDDIHSSFKPFKMITMMQCESENEIQKIDDDVKFKRVLSSCTTLSIITRQRVGGALNL